MACVVEGGCGGAGGLFCGPDRMATPNDAETNMAGLPPSLSLSLFSSLSSVMMRPRGAYLEVIGRGKGIPRKGRFLALLTMRIPKSFLLASLSKDNGLRFVLVPSSPSSFVLQMGREMTPCGINNQPSEFAAAAADDRSNMGIPSNIGRRNRIRDCQP
ncbi:hypothetical protein LZ30DRAFT_457547 [Colletotrichum cereale]|nr:hypothetical protein LZ30DRAFT_457547 [Colletotrichum cereale]